MKTKLLEKVFLELELEQDCGQVVTVGGMVSDKNVNLEQRHILANRNIFDILILELALISLVVKLRQLVGQYQTAWCQFGTICTK